MPVLASIRNDVTDESVGRRRTLYTLEWLSNPTLFFIYGDTAHEVLNWKAFSIYIIPVKFYRERYFRIEAIKLQSFSLREIIIIFSFSL